MLSAFFLVLGFFLGVKTANSKAVRWVRDKFSSTTIGIGKQ